jgi:hypothetical protein
MTFGFRHDFQQLPKAESFAKSHFQLFSDDFGETHLGVLSGVSPQVAAQPYFFARATFLQESVDRCPCAYWNFRVM